MSRFFKPYEGNKPFLFVSYSHRQSDLVVESIRILHDQGWRLWYDEGIPAGSDWPANIARHMEACEAVLFFLSGTALESPNCLSEIRTAARLHKPILVLRLEDIEPGEEWDVLPPREKHLTAAETAEGNAELILKSGFLKRRFHHRWTERIPWRALGLTASLLFFLAAAGAFAALATGRWSPFPEPEAAPLPVPTPTPTATPAPTPVPTVDLGGNERFFAVSFPDSQQERAVRDALQMPTEEIQAWNLAELSKLFFCGNMVRKDLNGVSFREDGSCLVNSAPVIQGRVKDLSLMQDMKRLEELALICQPVSKLSDLNGLTMLKDLNLAGSRAADLTGLNDLPALKTIHLEYTDVRDLTPLENLPALKTVTVSRDMLPLKWSPDARFEVILVR